MLRDLRTKNVFTSSWTVKRTLFLVRAVQNSDPCHGSVGTLAKSHSLDWIDAWLEYSRFDILSSMNASEVVLVAARRIAEQSGQRKVLRDIMILWGTLVYVFLYLVIDIQGGPRYIVSNRNRLFQLPGIPRETRCSRDPPRSKSGPSPFTTCPCRPHS